MSGSHVFFAITAKAKVVVAIEKTYRTYMNILIPFGYLSAILSVS